ncbi:hypothetical protein TIFTF001_005028 [Ficus carica]|uniref:Cytochrome P450 n=1 Tax=Ficus carica TaxID=3494 RepID=A0AA88A6D9_FICCA|nr:hypothetical protein TIFTF001_005028 [Ficus carica]
MLIFLYFLLFLAIHAFSYRFLDKIKNHPPSPFPVLPIIGHFYLFKKPLHRTLSKLSDRFGPVLLLRFGSRPVLLISSPSAADLVWAPYGDHWRNLRRISTLEILTSSRVQMMSHIRTDEIRSLMRRLVRSRNQTVELKSLFFELVLNVMMRMIAGKRYYGENVEPVEDTKRFQEMVRDTLRLGGTTNISDFLPVLRFVSRGYEKSLIELQEKRDRFMQRLIEENRERASSESSTSLSEENNKNMIQVLLFLQENEPDYYTDEIIRGMMLALFSAGTDTSSGLMEWAMSLMLNHPEVLKKAQDELEYCVGHDCLVDESDLPKLSYLHCIIKETMRMYPVGALIPHQSSEEYTVSGFRIPRDTMLLVNLWAIQNDPKVWDGPAKFKPKRFKELGDGMRDGFKLMPFGVGRRGCPGENLAMRMVGLTMASLIQCFERETILNEKIDMTEQLGLSLSKAFPSKLQYQPCPTMLNALSQI